MPRSLIVAAQYRERAARLRADEEHVDSPAGREAFLSLADNWDMLADAAEGIADRSSPHDADQNRLTYVKGVEALKR